MSEYHRSPSGIESFPLALGTACLTIALLGGAHAAGKAVEAVSLSSPASAEARVEAITVGTQSTIALGGSMIIYMLGAGTRRREDETE